MVVHAAKADYRSAFAGLQFPASRDEVVRRSRMQGGIDREVFAVLAAPVQPSAEAYPLLDVADADLSAVVSSHTSGLVHPVLSIFEVFRRRPSSSRTSLRSMTI